MTLTHDQIQQFHRDGYLAVGAVVSADELAAARAAYDRIFSATEKPSTYRDLGERADGRSEGAVLQIIDMWKLDDIFNQLLHKADTIDMVEAIVRDKKRIIPSAAFCEKEFGVAASNAGKGLFVGVPCVLGAKGVEKIITFNMTAEEKKFMDESISHVRDLIGATVKLFPELA